MVGICTEITMVDSIMARAKCVQVGYVAYWDWLTDVNLCSAFSTQQRKNKKKNLCCG